MPVEPAVPRCFFLDVDENKIFTTLSVTQCVFYDACDGICNSLFENHYCSRVSATITSIIFKVMKCCPCYLQYSHIGLSTLTLGGVQLFIVT